MRTIIYCRKSTDRSDMQVQSLDIQLEWALDYCKKNKMTIVETIAESKSASKVT
jgi:DNA invertase Pin-like site-specific DNA recombinase